jgi:hypothetical protein
MKHLNKSNLISKYLTLLSINGRRETPGIRPFKGILKVLQIIRKRFGYKLSPGRSGVNKDFKF